MRQFTFTTNENTGFDIPVTFETIEQAEGVIFYSMLNKENQQKIFDNIMQLTQEEDCCRWHELAYADKDIHTPISFIKDIENEGLEK